MTYRGIKIFEKNKKFRLYSPVNGTLRIFDTLEAAKHYIDNATVIDGHAKAMNN